MVDLHPGPGPQAAREPAQQRAAMDPEALQGKRPIDPRLAFDAAVSLARSSGAIRRAGQASQDLSRLTDSSYVLMGPGGGTLKRIPRPELLAELERLERLNGNLEQHRLRFGPGRRAVLISLLAAGASVVAVQAWVNEMNERRLASLEQSYLAHQQLLAQGPSAAQQDGLETINDFGARLQRARFDGCYQQVRDDLGRATEQLGSVQASAASDAYARFKVSWASCRQAMRRFPPRLFPS